MKTIKIIDLKKRTIYVDDIEQIYCDNSYIPERYNIQTTYGTYLVDKEDYFKVKDYLLSLNDEVEIIEEDKKIEKIYWDISDGTFLTNINNRKYEGHKDNFEELSDMYRQKLNEIIDYINKNKEEK